MYQLRSLGYKNLPFAILSKFFQLWVEFPMKVVWEKRNLDRVDLEAYKVLVFFKLMSNYNFLLQRLQLKFLILQKNRVYTFKRLIVPQRISL